MNTNEIRWKLHNYYADCEMIKQIKEDLKEYRLMDGIRAQVITDMPLDHNNTSKTELNALNRYEYISELESKLDSMMRVKMAIDEVYHYLKEPARTIIEMRYFITPMINDVRQPKYSWAQIAEEVQYGEDYCWKVDCKVIRQIQLKILG